MSKMEILHSLIDNIPVLSVSGKIDAMTSIALEVELVDLINQNKKNFDSRYGKCGVSQQLWPASSHDISK